MHRRALFASLAIAALAALGSFSSAASASPASAGGGSSAGRLGKALTKPTSTPFEFTIPLALVEPWYGPVFCKGHHQTNEKKGYPGTETEGGRDVEVCKSTTGKPLVGMTPGATGQTTFTSTTGEVVGGWQSDYFREVKGISVDTSDFTYSVSKSGKSFKIIAYY